MKEFFGHLGDENGGEVLKDGWHLLPPLGGNFVGMVAKRWRIKTASFLPWGEATW